MRVDTMPFPINAMELKNLVVLARHSQVDSPPGKNVIIGESNEDEKIENALTSMLKRFVDGRGNIKITISILGSGASEDS
jgi:hypothetical protein